MELESYPPVFRAQDTAPTQGVDSDEANKEIPEAEDDDPVPILDYRALELDALGDACRDWGLFRLVNHGVPPTLLAQLQQHARDLFCLPFHTKQQLFANSPLSYFWGTPVLTPYGAALPRGPRLINWVEGINVPLAQLPSFSPADPFLLRFRELLEEYGKQLGRLGRSVFEAMGKRLDLDSEQLRSYLGEETGFVRMYRYPKCGIMASESSETTWGMEAHTDSSVLSIVSQDGVGGLEVAGRHGRWHLVHPLPHALVFNLGDMLQAISDDRYRSAEHRVKANRYEERLSICYFVFPSQGCVIRSTRYRPFTYADFQSQVQQDVKTLGTKVGLARFTTPN